MALDILRGFRPDLPIDGVVTFIHRQPETPEPGWYANEARKVYWGYTPDYVYLLPLKDLENKNAVYQSIFLEESIQLFVEQSDRLGVRNILIPYEENSQNDQPANARLNSLFRQSLIAHQFDANFSMYLYLPEEKTVDLPDGLLDQVNDFLKERLIDPSSIEDSSPVSDAERRRCFDEYSDRYEETRISQSWGRSLDLSSACCFFASNELDEMLSRRDMGFAEYLIRLINQSGEKPSAVYHRALIDRKLFSKIRCNKDYKPTKPTAVAFAFALELDLETTQDLLRRAGFALSDSNEFDVIVKFFIERKMYNIIHLNAVLYDYDQPLIGTEI